MVALFAGEMMFASTGIAQAAPGGVPGAPAWSHKGGQQGCGNADVAIPSKSPADYAAHPDQFVTDPSMPPGMQAQLEQIALNKPTVVTSISCAPGQEHHATKVQQGATTWAGYWTGSSSYTDIFATITWIVPSLTGTSSNSAVSIWPGLGGGSSSDELVQAGTSQKSKSTVFWYEMYPYETMKNVTGISVAPGNKVQVMIYFNVLTKKATYDFYNYTANTFLAVQESLPAGHSYLGRQAEWIVEQPGFAAGGFAVLPNFGTISLSVAGFERSDSSSTTILNSSFPSLTIKNASNQVLASPGPASSTGNFIVTWKKSS